MHLVDSQGLFPSEMYLFNYCVDWKRTRYIKQMRTGAVKRRVFTMMYGPVRQKHSWRARYNRELFELYRELHVVATVAKTRLQ